MVVGDVTISASPSRAALGTRITFTGRVLIDGAPLGVGVTIYLDTSPATHVTLASGSTNSSGYYSLTWKSNYQGNLPIYARAAAYQGFNSPTIIVPIIDEGIVVYLEPPLNGARLEFRYRSYGMDQYLYSQLSVNGKTSWFQGSFTSYDLFEVRFPPQTVGGVPYLEARTGLFMYQAGPQVFVLNLQEGAIVVGTSITLSLSHSKLEPNKIFTWSGKLSRNDGGNPGSQTIRLLINGTIVDSTICDINGNFSATSITPSSDGAYSFRSHFGGATLTLGRLEASLSPEARLW